MTAILIDAPARPKRKPRKLTLASLARRNAVVVLTCHFGCDSETGRTKGFVETSGLVRRIAESCWVGRLCLPANTRIVRHVEEDGATHYHAYLGG